ncbi:hypothetical protein DAPPUDRAFT_244150 [Daphnia pulex]|uniref:Uncharacterized protein n=1 Tax=Daphnia pulex TaxID=6669 RepID=E9GKB5_DAPPU|nr:hypothetical protein DAPPUDRAFT_244150 [Daphnia pulex]|eukprot:EFX79958.1 hypothetical protein DAPPUDRAFT_244150 [Daphnia pulex]
MKAGKLISGRRQDQASKYLARIPHAKLHKDEAGKVATALLTSLYSPTYIQLHKRTPAKTKVKSCEDLLISLPGDELQQTYVTP